MTRLVLAVLSCASGLALAQSGAQEGIRHVASGDFKAAQEVLEKAVRDDPENSDHHLWLGVAIGRRIEAMPKLRQLGAAGQVKRVKTHFERAIELDPSNVEALETLMNFHLEAPAMVGGNKQTARELAEQIQAVDPARGAFSFAKLYEQARDHERAAASFQQARELDPTNTLLLLGHAEYLSKRGSHEESDRLFGEAFERDGDNPDVWAAATTAWISAKRRDLYPRARELGERYLATPSMHLGSKAVSDIRRLLKRL